MRKLQVGPIEIGRGCFRQFLRTGSGDFKGAQKGCCRRRGRMDQALPLRRREEYRGFRLIIVWQRLKAPSGWVANMSEAMRAVQSGSHCPDHSVDRSRQPPRAEPIAPIQKIVVRDVFKLQRGEGIGVPLGFGIEAQCRLELALGLGGGIRAIMAAQVVHIRNQGGGQGAALDGPDGRAGELREPFFSASLRIVIFERLPERLILLLLVAPAEPCVPRIWTSPKSQVAPAASRCQ